MQLTNRSSSPNPSERAPAAAPARRLRSLVLAWHDEESGDDLTIDVRGSERFLEGLAPLGFVPVGVPDRAAPSRRRASDAADHHVRWTVRLARYWKANRR